MDLAGLQRAKREGRKIVAVVAWDAPTAAIAERAGVDLVSVGDSVGVSLWGRKAGEPVTIEEMLVVCKAVRRGAQRTLVSCDLPEKEDFQRASILVKEGGADMVKLLASPAIVAGVVKKGVRVFAEFHGDQGTPEELVKRAKELEEAGASLLDFRHSGPLAGAAVAQAVKIPVIGGLGGGPWLDGRVRRAHTAIGYADKWLDSKTDTYVNTAKAALGAFTALIADVRAGKQIKG
jgi:3-methyl-2-oxobutanoate hydroxymethyltransferase